MQKLEILKASPLFEMLSSEELDYMAELARPKHVKAGEVIFDEGALGNSIYVIGQGQVEILARQPSGSTRVLTVLNRPQFFGEMSLIDKEHRSATVRARTDADLAQLTVENLATFRRRYRDGFTFIVINIARTLSSRLRDANSKIVVAP